MVVFHEEIRPADKRPKRTPILVSQNFFRQDDRYVMENGQQRDKFVTRRIPGPHGLRLPGGGHQSDFLAAEARRAACRFLSALCPC